MKTTHYPPGHGPTSAEVDLVERAFLDLVQKQDGTLITHAQIAAAAGLEYASLQYYRVARRWVKRMRREHGIVLTACVGEGYRAIPDAEKPGAVLDQHRRSARHIRKGMEIVQATDRAALPPLQQRTYDTVATATADLLRRSRSLTTNMTAELKATAPTPALPPVSPRVGDE